MSDLYVSRHRYLSSALNASLDTTRPVVGGPTPDDGVEPYQHRYRVGPSQGTHLCAQPFPDPTQRRLTRLDQQLACLSADGEPQKVETLVEGDNTRLVLVEGQTPGRQPYGKPRLDLFGLVPGVTQGDQIIGIPNQNWGISHRLTGMNTGYLVPDPGGLFHPMQSNIQKQRADHPALRSSLLGRSEPTFLNHARLEPVGDQSPGRERAELVQEIGVIDAVERPCQIRVQDPSSPGVGTPGDVEDGLDRIMAATARPKPIRPRLEPCFPLGLQRVLSLIHISEPTRQA